MKKTSKAKTRKRVSLIHAFVAGYMAYLEGEEPEGVYNVPEILAEAWANGYTEAMEVHTNQITVH